MLSSKLAWLRAVGLCGAAIAYPPCTRLSAATPAAAIALRQSTDTATVRLHISGMTCGTCPATARLALRRVTGVYSATVTLDDSLGVVRFDPRHGTAARIAADLTRLTGYRATVLPDTTRAPQRRS